MEILGFVDLRANDKDLPPKIWRALMLEASGLPVTNYMIVDRENIPERLVIKKLQTALKGSKTGLVVRAVSRGDFKKEPYQWLRSPWNGTLVIKSEYLMAFVPLATPDKSFGFVVGRYWRTAEDTIVEYIQNEVRPRMLECVENNNTNGFNRIIRECGGFFRSQWPDSRAQDVYQMIKKCEEGFSALDLLLGENSSYSPCYEFTIHRNNREIEFHDFDF